MTEVTREQSEQSASYPRRIFQYFSELNLYDSDQNLSTGEQLLATRLNLFGLLLSITILLVIRGFHPQTETALIDSPTLPQFDQLSAQYPLTLSCPCSETNTPYAEMLSITLQYHQICSSDFLTQTWISALFNPNRTNYYALDFRLSASSQFQIIALLCRIASQAVADAVSGLRKQKMISAQLISRENFASELNSSIAELRSTVTTDVGRMDQYLELNMAYNDLISSLQSNYFVSATPGKSGYGTSVGYYLSTTYQNISDYTNYNSCYNNYTAAFYAGIYPNGSMNGSYFYSPWPAPIYSVPGILAGCLPRFSLMQSTLECLYDVYCLNTLQSLGIGTASSQPLNASKPSRFAVNETFRSMFNDLLIEQWQNTLNFSSYFHICAPSSCSYTYAKQFSALYMLTSVLGLLGGLTTAFGFLTPFLVKHVLRQIRRKCCCTNAYAAENNAGKSDRSLCQKIKHVFRTVAERLLTLNVFEKSILLSDSQQKNWATRIYLILLVLGTIILAIYSAVISHIQTVTVNYPSREQFEALDAQYSFTLSCPCTQLSTPYATIMSIQPRFSQICSSDFVRQDRWLQYFTFVPLNNGLTTAYLYSLDFRLNAGRSIFRFLSVLCEFANETVWNALSAFNQTQLVSNNPLTAKSFNQQTSSLIDQFQKQTLGSFLSLFTLMRTTIEENQFHTSTHTNLQYNNYSKDGTYYIGLKAKAFPNTTDTCLTSNQCAQAIGFYCYGTQQCPQLNLNKTVPGLVLSCIPIDALLLSTLECFYNQSCIQMLFDWRLFGYENVYKPLSLNVTPLNPNASSRFSPNTPLGDIVSGLLIEEWHTGSDVDAHYQHCQPKVCTYTYVSRFAILYVITTVIGLLGGLSVILRLIIPLLIKFLIKQLEKRRQLRVTPSNQLPANGHTALERQSSLFLRMKQSISDMRILHAQINNSILATRIYFLALFAASMTVLVFTAASYQAQTHTVSSPSLSTFETTYADHHADRLSCLCSQTSTAYGTFLSLSLAYHQVCSSDFVSSNWWKLIANRGSEPFYLLDQPLLSVYFRILSSFCALAEQTVSNAIDSLLANTLISVQALSRSAFEEQIRSTVDILVDETPVKFIHELDYIIDTYRSNQLEHLFLTSWTLEYSTQMLVNKIVRTRPRVYNNGTCICATSMSATCFRSMAFQAFNTSAHVTLPGFVGGCLAMDGLRQSTLECLFDSACLNEIGLLINNTNAYSPPTPLNSSLESRFPSLTTNVDTLLRELFIEEWFNATNYSAYYQSCAPSACYYESIARNTFVYSITFFLGLYGGLTVSFRLIVICTFKLAVRTRDWWNVRRR